MATFIEKILGVKAEKRRYKDIQTRAKRLPEDYAATYERIKKYLWNTAGITTIEPLANLVEIFEQGAADDLPVEQVTGSDVAKFADEIAEGEASYRTQQRSKLNKTQKPTDY